MPLKLMFITNRPDVALIAQNEGVDRIFIDMEYIGKADRQGGMDSVKNHHTVEDVKRVRSVLTKAELLVRVNPIHDATDEYCSSEEEIDAVIEAGADIVMLPFFKTVAEVKRFIGAVKGRAKAMLLLETPEAAECVDDILRVPGVDEIHVGINDLSLGYGKTFMFELLCDGTVEGLCLKFKKAGIPFGFGGVAAVGTGMLPAEAILKEHYRLGSSMVILSRSFCSVGSDPDLNLIAETFRTGVRNIREYEKEISVHSGYFAGNEEYIKKCVGAIVEKIRLQREAAES